MFQAVILRNKKTGKVLCTSHFGDAKYLGLMKPVLHGQKVKSLKDFELDGPAWYNVSQMVAEQVVPFMWRDKSEYRRDIYRMFRDTFKNRKWRHKEDNRNWSTSGGYQTNPGYQEIQDRDLWGMVANDIEIVLYDFGTHCDLRVINFRQECCPKNISKMYV